MFQCTFITCMGKGILPLRYNDIKKLRVKILLWMETVTHMSYWCSHFIDLVVKEHAHKTSESLILFYGEMSGKFGKPSGDSRRAFGHCRKTHREHSESLRVILGEYSDIVVKRILTTRGFRDVSRFWNSGGWQVCFWTCVMFVHCKGIPRSTGKFGSSHIYRTELHTISQSQVVSTVFRPSLQTYLSHWPDVDTISLGQI